MIDCLVSRYLLLRLAKFVYDTDSFLVDPFCKVVQKQTKAYYSTIQVSWSSQKKVPDYLVNECTKKGNGMFTNWYFSPGRYVLQ